MTTPLGAPELEQNQASKYITHNEALHHFDMWLRGVKSRTTDAPPGSPAEGDAYIITDAPTGDWSSFDEHNIALYFNSNWEEIAAHEGPNLLIEDEDVRVAWNDTDSEYVIVASAMGVNTQTGTAYTLVLSDTNTLVRMNNAAANTLTVPTNADEEFAIGAIVAVWEMGAGTTSIAGDTGVTVTGTFSTFCYLMKVDTDTWIIK